MHAGGEGLKEVAAPRSEDFRALFVFISEEASLFRFVSCSKAPTAKEGWYRRICSFGKGREAEICDWITNFSGDDREGSGAIASSSSSEDQAYNHLFSNSISLPSLRSAAFSFPIIPIIPFPSCSIPSSKSSESYGIGMVVSPIESMSGTAYLSVLASLSLLHRNFIALGKDLVITALTYLSVASLESPLAYYPLVAWIGVGTVRNS